jgi:acyl-CoA thioester hydrolase
MDGVFRYEITVRYSECDMQQVVFNANYMAYCDDAVDSWFQSRLGSRNLDFDFMLKNFQISWFSPLRYRDDAVLECRLVRWGNTSLEIRIAGSVGESGGGAGGDAGATGSVGGAGGRKVFEATLTYVSVVPGEVKTTPVPDWVKGQIGLAA